MTGFLFCLTGVSLKDRDKGPDVCLRSFLSEFRTSDKLWTYTSWRCLDTFLTEGCLYYG